MTLVMLRVRLEGADLLIVPGAAGCSSGMQHALVPLQDAVVLRGVVLHPECCCCPTRVLLNEHRVWAALSLSAFLSPFVDSTFPSVPLLRVSRPCMSCRGELAAACGECGSTLFCFVRTARVARRGTGWPVWLAVHHQGSGPLESAGLP